MFTPKPRARPPRVPGAAALAALCVLVGCGAETPEESQISVTEPGSGEAVQTAQQPASDPSFPYQVSALERRPELVNRGEIASTMERLYPSSLQDAGIGGTVLIEFVIATDGDVEPASIRVLDDGGLPDLAEATVETARTFRFEPGVYQDRQVRAQVQMPVTWQPAG